MSRPRVAIVGAGLAGSLLAGYLARRGYPVTLYERRPDPRGGQSERGRSINLALSERGLDALRRVGLDGSVLAAALPMRGRMVHAVAGEPDFQPYSLDGERAINSISRGALNNALLDAATALPGVSAVFGHQLVGLDPKTAVMTFATAGGQVEIEADVVLGADGAGSAVRGQLRAHGLTGEDIEFLDYGYKELTIPARPDGGFALDPHALHIWPRGSSMMIALPNPDHSFTCTLFWPLTGPGSFESLATDAEIRGHFAVHYPDVPDLAPDLLADYRANPVGKLGTVRTAPWQAYGRVGLIGDAAHAIVPFYGQGANCAFEDVVELDRCLRECGDEWPAALARYESRRSENADAIAEMALDNFVEMRDRVASPVYLAGRRAEQFLQRLLPQVYQSRYELVSFSTTPYAQVQRQVRRQHQVLAGVAAAVGAAVLVGVSGALRRRR
ncbi:kynurenine 3-monooxygenase [Pilimelia terevasa]|uniref:Kynurenine 3-monooxygenase n=1 Tax=Pilimelia terevasa TaxID=53372 RepID=A0A8J3BUA0_9ACTN|nr:NAD(P)/FAD-dependent oxidoreductase [Pilimelia terevasa]GGK42848.1 kynurenine 3-monooxygenase [Pilimelia terevasa]